MPGKIVLSTDDQITQCQALNETSECTLYVGNLTTLYINIFNSVEQVSPPSETLANLLLKVGCRFHFSSLLPAISNPCNLKLLWFSLEVWNSGI